MYFSFSYHLECKDLTRMEKGLMLEERKLYVSYFNLLLEEKNVYVSMHVRVYTEVCLNEGSLKWALKWYFGTPSSTEQLLMYLSDSGSLAGGRGEEKLSPDWGGVGGGEVFFKGKSCVVPRRD